MEKILKSLFPIMVAALLLVGCKDDVEYKDTGTDPVSQLLIPDDNLGLQLINNENATQYFSWTPPSTTTAFNYGVVFYGSADGQEIYRMESDDSGTRPYATIKHDYLVKIAAAAGIGNEQTGDIYWNVISMRGGNESQPTASRRRITLTRYATFDDIPYSLYIYGEATEAGGDPAASPKFKSTDDGVFEIYTKLEGGKEYSLTNRADAGDKRTFIIDDGVLKEEDASVTAPDGIYRISVDFNTARVTMEEVQNVWYYYPNDDAYMVMDYVGYGHWQTDEFTLAFSDDRYHFRAMVDGVEELWGHQDLDTQSVPDELSGSYFDIYIHEPVAGDRWKYSYKFNSVLQGVDLSLHVYMSSDISNYTHIIDAGDVDPIPVTQFNSPADNYDIDLVSLGTGTLTFDWNAVVNPNGPGATYELVFFADTDMTEQISSISTGTSTSVAVSRNDLQSIGTQVAGDDQTAVTVYWTVRTTIVGNTTLASVGPRALNINLLTIPTVAYISGGDSEFGSGFRLLKATGAEGEGKFETYTRLSGTDYYFTDGNSGTYRIFYADASAGLVENAGASNARNGIFRISLDFLNETVEFEEIDKVELFQCSQGSTYDLTYAGGGIWELNNQQMGTGDNRYLFRAYLDGDSNYTEKWASMNSNNDKGPGEDGFVEEGFWDIYLNDTNRDNWDYSFKFYNSRMDNCNVTIKVHMTPDAEIYYHEVTYN